MGLSSLLLMENIYKVAIAGFELKTVTILKRATIPEFTTVIPILYIHCYAKLFIYS